MFNFFSSSPTALTTITSNNNGTTNTDCPSYYLETSMKKLVLGSPDSDNNLNEQTPFPLSDLELTLSNGDTITLCRTMTEKRLPNGLGEYFQLLTTAKHLQVISSYIYFDGIPRELDLLIIVSVYHWALKSQAPEHLINLLLNHFIRELGSDNVVSVLSFCKHLRQSLGCNDGYLERIESHCLRLILQFVDSGKADSVRDLRDRKDLHSEILFHASEGSLMQAQLSNKSTFKQDIQELFTERKGRLHIQIHNDTSRADSFISLTPCILSANSEYVRTLLTCEWLPKDFNLPLYQYGLDEEEYKGLSMEEKEMRQRVLTKFLSLLFYVSVNLDVEESMQMLELCNFLLVPRDHFVYEKCILVLEQNVRVENVLQIAQKLSDLQEADSYDNTKEIHNVRLIVSSTLKNKVIQVLSDNWKEIRNSYSSNELLEHLSVGIVFDVTDRLADRSIDRNSFIRSYSSPPTDSQTSWPQFDGEWE